MYQFHHSTLTKARSGAKGLYSLLTDLYTLIHYDFIVCTLSSNVSYSKESSNMDKITTRHSGQDLLYSYYYRINISNYNPCYVNII